MVLCIFQEQLLSLAEAVLDGFDGLAREELVFDDELMQVVSEVVSALVATMPIVDPEERALWPFHARELLLLWLHDIEYDCYSILVVVPESKNSIKLLIEREI